MFSDKGVVTSLAWGMGGEVAYVFEGNINYTGAVTRWVVDDLHLLDSAAEAGAVAAEADPEDGTYLVPAFTGLGAPYWKPEARAAFCGMSRTTGRAELVKAAEVHRLPNRGRRPGDGGGFRRADRRAARGWRPHAGQISDAVSERHSEHPGRGAAARGLSGIGAAYCAGIAAGVYSKAVLARAERSAFVPLKGGAWQERSRYQGWKNAVGRLL